MPRVRVLAALVLLASTLTPTSAFARTDEQYDYSYEQLWRAAVRLIAVDFRFPITQRDEEAGYLLFEYRDRGRTFDGSLELVRSSGRSVTVVVSVSRMPTYVERMVLDRFGRKLSAEYGAPPPPPTPTPTPTPDDEPEGDEDEDSPEDSNEQP